MTKNALALAVFALCTGCAQVVTAPRVDMHVVPPLDAMMLPMAAQAAQAALAMQAAPAATQGAIFQAALHRPLFEDRRARLVGDTLTIQIDEQVTASQQSTSKLARDGSISADVKALPFGSAKVLGKLSTGASSGVTGSGDGKTDSANAFTGTITVLVRQVMANGNLLVTGEKQIGVNQNVDVMRFSGIVNPATIRAGNTVSSTLVAEARLEQRGRGDIGNIQGLGWLSRFFLSIAPV